tara:strand:- start:247 stop:501 length:255 start_codon:yes stop_codon:yes gene_type:complete
MSTELDRYNEHIVPGDYVTVVGEAIERPRLDWPTLSLGLLADEGVVVSTNRRESRARVRIDITSYETTAWYVERDFRMSELVRR